jgi:hypothetical protein
MKSRQKKYKITGQQLSEIFGISVSYCQQLRRFSDMPDTDNKEKLIEWYEEHKKQVSAKRKKLKHYKLSNTTISGLLKLSGKTTANKVSELRYAGLPDTSNLEEVKNWYKQWKEKQSKLGKLATLQSIGDVLGVTRERVRQFKEMGMPFNESSSPIEDAVAWHKWRKEQPRIKGKIQIAPTELFLKLNKENNKEAIGELNLIKENQQQIANEQKETRTLICKSLRLFAPEFKKLVQSGMPTDSFEEASRWFEENTYKTPSGTIKVKSVKNMRVLIYKSLGINGYQYDKLVQLGMPTDSLEEASRWFEENTYKTPRGKIKVKSN